MVEEWIINVKSQANPEELGMILIHNGVVRATSKNGKSIKGMHLTYNKKNLNNLVDDYIKREGIITIKVWINEGKLKVGEDIMYILVAGKFRKYVLPVLDELVSRIKNEILSENEY